MISSGCIELNNHRLQAGGLVSRIASPDTGHNVRLCRCSEIVVYFGLKMLLGIVFDHPFGKFFLGNAKIPPPCPKMYSPAFLSLVHVASSGFAEPRFLIRRIISLGAILGGADTKS
jgi:hypothetical protein